METQEFDRKLREETEWVEEVLSRHLPRAEGPQKTVVEAMNYSLTAGGKRLRPILMRETYRMCGGTDETLIGFFMAAIEMLHTYSLVHDDLPVMDNDQYRRGRKTTWCVYGDAMGVLAGDGLLNYSFETALGAAEYSVSGDSGTELTDAQKLRRVQRVCRALAILGKKAGIYGMIGGQTVDIEAEKCIGCTEEELIFIHEHKTAALIQAAMMIGAVLAGASEEQVADIEKCARNIGIAFQIQDDILDVVGDSEELGKSVGSDAQNHKQTYVTLKGLEQSKADVEALSREAAAILDGFEGDHEFLRQLILTLIHRHN